jgi:hypothetical protein
MEKATEPKPDKPAGEGRGKRGDTKSKLTIHEECGRVKLLIIMS